VLDLSKPPIVIDEPGRYALQRDWVLTGSRTRLEHVDVDGQEPMVLEGARATITDSVVHTRWGIVVNESAIIRSNALSSRTCCLTLQGAMNQVIDNRFSYQDADVVAQVDGDASVIEGNVLDEEVFGPGEAYAVAGENNVVRDNTITGGGWGNNRMAAQVPFNLGATVQTDWGGNVGY
jgi:hypothetical protein